MDTFKADTTSLKDYSVNWSSRLEAGETLISSVWTVPAGITQAAGHPQTFTPAGLATIWLTGGTLDTLYRLINHVVTSAGREYDDSFNVYVMDL